VNHLLKWFKDLLTLDTGYQRRTGKNRKDDFDEYLDGISVWVNVSCSMKQFYTLTSVFLLCAMQCVTIFFGTRGDYLKILIDQ
jgi:hypothetical protein